MLHQFLARIFIPSELFDIFQKYIVLDCANSISDQFKSINLEHNDNFKLFANRLDNIYCLSQKTSWYV